MPANSPSIYRQRIYTSYVSARDRALAPLTLDGLRPRLRYFRKMVRQYFPPDKNASIFELGCGHGALLYQLQQEGYCNVTGVDGSLEQVNAAKKLGINGVSQGDVIETLAAKADASLDVVIAFDLIEHFTKSELIFLVDEVCRILKPGGHWIIHVPNAESPFFATVRYGDFTHEIAFTRVSLSQLLKSSGFDSPVCVEDRPVIHDIKSFVRSMFWRVIRVSLLFYNAVETGRIDRSSVFSRNLLAVATKNIVNTQDKDNNLTRTHT